MSVVVDKAARRKLNPAFGLVWSGKLLLAFASTLIFGSESHGAHNHILLPRESGTDRKEKTSSNISTRHFLCDPHRSSSQNFLHVHSI
jgi:hypothetical protein